MVRPVEPASTCPRGGAIDAATVAHYMPAVEVSAVQVDAGAVEMDYTAKELLYNTDAYAFMLERHFTSKKLRVPATLRDLASSASRVRRFTVLWNGRHLSLR